jgi:hypothetical protein
MTRAMPGYGNFSGPAQEALKSNIGDPKLCPTRGEHFIVCNSFEQTVHFYLTFEELTAFPYDPNYCFLPTKLAC